MKFVSYEKMSKKDKKAFNASKRTMWDINPVTRKPANSRAYNRNAAKSEARLAYQ